MSSTMSSSNGDQGFPSWPIVTYRQAPTANNLAGDRRTALNIIFWIFCVVFGLFDVLSIGGLIEGLKLFFVSSVAFSAVLGFMFGFCLAMLLVFVLCLVIIIALGYALLTQNNLSSTSLPQTRSAETASASQESPQAKEKDRSTNCAPLSPQVHAMVLSSTPVLDKFTCDSTSKDTTSSPSSSTPYLRRTKTSAPDMAVQSHHKDSKEAVTVVGLPEAPTSTCATPDQAPKPTVSQSKTMVNSSKSSNLPTIKPAAIGPCETVDGDQKNDTIKVEQAPAAPQTTTAPAVQPSYTKTRKAETPPSAADKGVDPLAKRRKKTDKPCAASTAASSVTSWRNVPGSVSKAPRIAAESPKIPPGADNKAVATSKDIATRVTTVLTLMTNSGAESMKPITSQSLTAASKAPKQSSADTRKTVNGPVAPTANSATATPDTSKNAPAPTKADPSLPQSAPREATPNTNIASTPFTAATASLTPSAVKAPQSTRKIAPQKPLEPLPQESIAKSQNSVATGNKATATSNGFTVALSNTVLVPLPKDGTNPKPAAVLPTAAAQPPQRVSFKIEKQQRGKVSKTSASPGKTFGFATSQGVKSPKPQPVTKAEKKPKANTIIAPKAVTAVGPESNGNKANSQLISTPIFNFPPLGRVSKPAVVPTFTSTGPLKYKAERDLTAKDIVATDVGVLITKLQAFSMKDGPSSSEGGAAPAPSQVASSQPPVQRSPTATFNALDEEMKEASQPSDDKICGKAQAAPEQGTCAMDSEEKQIADLLLLLNSVGIPTNVPSAAQTAANPLAQIYKPIPPPPDLMGPSRPTSSVPVAPVPPSTPGPRSLSAGRPTPQAATPTAPATAPRRKVKAKRNRTGPRPGVPSKEKPTEGPKRNLAMSVVV